ncbi:MAG: hypothetical protein JZU58_04220 [Curvibacter lanceolatus]|nr:hypothetical protein [Curvibacter lanceolatus]
MTKASDARLETRAARNGLVQTIHQLVHDGGRAKALEPVLDFCEDGMSLTMANVDVDDMNVFERRLKNTRAEFEAVTGKLGPLLIGRHFL